MKYSLNYTMFESYKGYDILFYQDLYTYYAIGKDGEIIENYLTTRRSAKLKITKLIKEMK